MGRPYSGLFLFFSLFLSTPPPPPPPNDISILKSLCHVMETFLQTHKIKSVLFICALMVFVVFEELTVVIFKCDFYACFYKINYLSTNSLRTSEDLSGDLDPENSSGACDPEKALCNLHPKKGWTLDTGENRTMLQKGVMTYEDGVSVSIFRI
jgi:hypothetical protein